MKEKVYQIKVEGRYKYFSGVCKIFSQNVYRHYPTKEEQETFFGKCHSTPHDNPSSMWDLDIDEPYTIKIVELVLND